MTLGPSMILGSYMMLGSYFDRLSPMGTGKGHTTGFHDREMSLRLP